MTSQALSSDWGWAPILNKGRIDEGDVGRD